MKKRNYQGNSKGTLTQLLRARQEIAKLKRLNIEASIEAIREKRRAKMEQAEAGCYADLIGWIENYLFPVPTLEDLRTKIEEYKTFRSTHYKKLYNETKELEKVEVSVYGRRMTIYVK